MPWTQVCCVGRPVIIHHTIAIGHTQAHACMCDVHVCTGVQGLCVVYTGLVVGCMYWFGVLYVLDWVC